MDAPSKSDPLKNCPRASGGFCCVTAARNFSRVYSFLFIRSLVSQARRAWPGVFRLSIILPCRHHNALYVVIYCAGRENRSQIIFSPSLENFRDHASQFLAAARNIAPAFDSRSALLCNALYVVKQCAGRENRSQIIFSPSLENFRDHASQFLAAARNIAPAFDSRSALLCNALYVVK